MEEGQSHKFSKGKEVLIIIRLILGNCGRNSTFSGKILHFSTPSYQPANNSTTNKACSSPCFIPIEQSEHKKAGSPSTNFSKALSIRKLSTLSPTTLTLIMQQMILLDSTRSATTQVLPLKSIQKNLDICYQQAKSIFSRMESVV